MQDIVTMETDHATYDITLREGVGVWYVEVESRCRRVRRAGARFTRAEALRAAADAVGEMDITFARWAAEREA